MESYGQTAADAARLAGDLLLERFQLADPGQVEQKARNDFVSEADRQSEKAIFELLASRYPTHALLGEEGGFRRFPDAGEVPDGEWIVDPLDGTANFVHGYPVFGVSVALRQKGELLAGAVIDPTRDDLWVAERGGGAFWNGRRISVSDKTDFADAFVATGFPFRARKYIDAYLALFKDVFLNGRAIRRAGAAALDLAYVASGIFDAFFELKLSAWDLAAGCLLIEEAGGRVSDLDGGDRYLERGSILASAPGIYDRLLELSSRHVNEAMVDEPTE